MKIKIVSQTNLKLLQNFPKDPYSDITIFCKNNKYCLILAYLSIDSAYFGQLQAGVEINLSHFPSQQLTKVLKAMYGGQLQVNSIAQLESIYKIIKYLQIQQYQHSLAEEIISRQDLLESIDILVFCLDNNFKKKQILNYHLDHDLHILTNSKNYLRLNKIHAQNLNSILIQYYQRVGQKSDETINHILQNYLNRNKLGANDYFLNFWNFQYQNQSMLPLIKIWEKHHHKLNIKDFVKYKSLEDLVISKPKKQPIANNTFQNMISQNKLNLVQQTSIQNQQSSYATDSSSAQSGSLSQILLTRVQQLKKTHSGSSFNYKIKPKQINNQNLLSIPSPKNRAHATLSEYLNQKRSCILEKASQSDNSDCDQPMPKYGTGSERIQRSNCLNMTFGGFTDNQKLKKSNHTKIQQESEQKSHLKSNFQIKKLQKSKKIQDNPTQTKAATSQQIYSDLKSLLIKLQTKKYYQSHQLQSKNNNKVKK